MENIKRFAVYLDKSAQYIHTCELGPNVTQKDVLKCGYVNETANMFFPISIIWAQSHEEAKKHYIDWDIDKAYRH